MQFVVDPAGRKPLGQQLGEQVRAAVATGALRPGERLPSVRELSRELVVNPNTVARVYAELEQAGLVYARPGLGVFVAEPRVELAERFRRERLQAALGAFLTEAVLLGFGPAEVLSAVERQLVSYAWREADD
ncbi:MAG: GntR family transcriptional regulator [Armatimonadetes bacterium]|nr:GntR family transcriptional regulator [Armatimonadota bacterium]